MSRILCHLNGLFFEYSTVVGAPVTDLMTEEEFTVYAQRMYGDLHVEHDLPGRFERARARGHSSLDNDSPTLEEYIKGNRAGPKEGSLSIKGLIKHYFSKSIHKADQVVLPGDVGPRQ